MVSDTSMFLLRLLGWLGLGALLAVGGAIYFLRASGIADMIAQRLSIAHPFRCLWLSVRFCSCALLSLGGSIYFLQAPGHADMIAQRLSIAHPFWRLWLPVRFCSSGRFLLQLRITAAGVVLIGLLLILSALVSLVYHP